MSDKKIQEEYKKIFPDQEQLPEYSDPDTFTKNMEKCSILIYGDEVYSDSSTVVLPKQNA